MVPERACGRDGQPHQLSLAEITTQDLHAACRTRLCLSKREPVFDIGRDPSSLRHILLEAVHGIAHEPREDACWRDVSAHDVGRVEHWDILLACSVQNGRCFVKELQPLTQLVDRGLHIVDHLPRLLQRALEQVIEPLLTHSVGLPLPILLGLAVELFHSIAERLRSPLCCLEERRRLEALEVHVLERANARAHADFALAHRRESRTVAAARLGALSLIRSLQRAFAAVTRLRTLVHLYGLLIDHCDCTASRDQRSCEHRHGFIHKRCSLVLCACTSASKSWLRRPCRPHAEVSARLRVHSPDIVQLPFASLVAEFRAAICRRSYLVRLKDSVRWHHRSVLKGGFGTITRRPYGLRAQPALPAH